MTSSPLRALRTSLAREPPHPRDGLLRLLAGLPAGQRGFLVDACLWLRARSKPMSAHNLHGMAIEVRSLHAHTGVLPGKAGRHHYEAHYRARPRSAPNLERGAGHLANAATAAAALAGKDPAAARPAAKKLTSLPDDLVYAAVTPRAGKPATPDTVEAMLRTLKNGRSRHRLRNLALTETHWLTGYRPGNLLALLLPDFERLGPGHFRITPSAAVGRRGKTERPVTIAGAFHLDAWHRDAVRLRLRGMWPSQQGAHAGRALGLDGLSDIYKAACQRLKHKVRPHDFRRGNEKQASTRPYATDAERSRSRGWADRRMPARYAQAGDDDIVAWFTTVPFGQRVHDPAACPGCGEARLAGLPYCPGCGSRRGDDHREGRTGRRRRLARYGARIARRAMSA